MFSHAENGLYLPWSELLGAWRDMQHGLESESEGDAKQKRHRRDRDGARRNGGLDELEDGEVGEDGEIR